MTDNRERFERAFGLIIEGACPKDGGPLERRPGWGYVFCVECGEGWMAETSSEHRPWLGRYSDQSHWSPTTGLSYSQTVRGQTLITFPMPLPEPFLVS